ncbi:glycosyltransferase family 2 protein [Roseibium sp.]|uniref:glycosyltransferase family 2 protein n=1 Tax=Roseibium sp. TaxID=1936156 RepID=UPI003B51366D
MTADNGAPGALPHDLEPEQVAELTVIVVSYNTRDLTLKALDTLYATTTDCTFEVIVYDNASADGSAEAIAAAFPQVHLIAADENIGFARANNVAAGLVKTEWILLLNPDTECHEAAVDSLLAFGKSHPSGGIYGGRTVFPDGTLNIASCWNKMTPWSLFCGAFGLSRLFSGSEFFNPEALGGWKRDTVRRVDIVVGCFLLVRRSLWQELEGFNTRYFMYGEEADLCLRARRLGYRPMITPDAEIMHLVGAASSVRAEKAILVAKAKSTLIRDHWPKTLQPLGRGLLFLWAFGRFSGSSLLGWVKPSGVSQKQPDPDQMGTWQRVWYARNEWLAGYE